jgi:Cu/Zn superoxide dismutase
LNSQHGFHVHEFGDLTGTDRATNTGGHWNPTGTNHAYPPSTSRHYGDMGNITADSNGVAAFDKTFDLLTLNGVNSILGRGIVIHEKADDGQGATGNAGNKLGSCTIGYVSALPALQTFCPILQLTSKATSLLVGTSDNTGISGKVEFDYDGSKTTISGTISGLAANSIHGFHIHEFGDLSKDDGTATGF